MAAFKQHAIVKKRVGEGVVFVFFFISYSPSSCFGLNLRHMVVARMYCEIQNKQSNTRGSLLGYIG